MAIIQTSMRSEEFKRTIEESRQKFLGNLCNNASFNENNEDAKIRHNSNESTTKKKQTPRKISFKVRRTSSIYKKNVNVQKTTITVAELASKFNDIIEKHNATSTTTTKEEINLKKLAKKLNNTNIKVKQQNETKKPSIKKKPILIASDDKSKVQIRKKINNLNQEVVILDKNDGVKVKLNENLGFVKAAIENFEKKTFQTQKSLPSEGNTKKNEQNRRQSCKPDIDLLKIPKEKEENVHHQVVEIISKSEPNLTKKSSTNYEILIPNKPLKNNNNNNNEEEEIKIWGNSNLPKIDEEIKLDIKPNTSFLWTRCSSIIYQDVTIPKPILPQSKTLPRDFKGNFQIKEKIYEELDGYEPFDIRHDDKKDVDVVVSKENDYEFLQNNIENIYECLPSPKRSSSSKSSGSYYTIKEESSSNCYESIYNASLEGGGNNNYESIYLRKDNNSEKDIAGSIVSSEQKTNSLYGTSLRSWNDGTIYNESTTSDISFSDKSEWIDVSENEYDDENSKIIIIREAVKNKKGGNWSKQCRQWSKSTTTLNKSAVDDSDSDHHYETLHTTENQIQDTSYDSFPSDVESEDSFENLDDQEDVPLPAAPNSNDVLTRLAASATKHMRKFTKNLSLTRSDISKSLTRITRRKSKNDINEFNDNNYEDTLVGTQEAQGKTVDENNEKNKSFSRKGILYKIRRSIIMSPEQANEITSHIAKGSKSKFYLTPTINIDDPEDSIEKKTTEDDSGISLSPIDRDRNYKNKLSRPQNPPPPAPILNLNDELKTSFKEKRTTSWYAELKFNKEPEKESPKSPNLLSNTCWYDEIGLYPKSASTPSSSSTENSGTNTTTPIQIQETNQTVSLPGEDIQMRLQNEPLYQFYDAAVLNFIFDGISDSDNYEDVIEKDSELRRHQQISRPSAMEIIEPKRNSLAFQKTLWCEIPEVLQSSVLSTLSSHQKKLQEAKFEMVTSEASYLNSLNVLNDHFINNLKSTLTDDEFQLLFSKIEDVRISSDKLLLDLEKCWQDNILLQGVCDIIKKHAENNFSVYIPYCENHILLDQTIKKLRERPIFAETLRLLEASPICQCLSLYSFLMLPMQRITRWPLLLDAVLKRLEDNDPEYNTCQYVLATTNRIVNECNEAARNVERELEMLNIESKMEYTKGVQPFKLAIPNRWLIRSGNVVHMQPRNEEKLTFGKKISKVNLHLFLFNDLLFVTKPRSDGQYTVLHYCSRNFTELSTSEQLLSIPGKDMTGKNLFFLTLLENQHQKTVEFLLSCNSESDKQRWLEALSPPKSENPDETLYECWDCPQVTVIHNYNAVQPDELNLTKGDILNVSRKMADGWYQGEKIRDGKSGWFPANYTAEIANPHVRARNLKLRYRLLTFSENYLKNK